MRVLIAGGGGREHALAWSASRSPQVKEVFVAPGNAGTALEPKVKNVATSPDDIDSMLGFALQNAIDFTIVGPEQPLTMGIADVFKSNHLPCFGPNAAASQLEGSKSFTKDFASRHGIATAQYGTFEKVEPALDCIRQLGLPAVIKADGLAAGKGVIIAESIEQARSTLVSMLQDGKFGSSGKKVVVEQFIEGEEASYICLVDGQDIVALATSQDHKAAFDGDRGPNTGGMGAYSPAPVIDDKTERQILSEIIEPTVNGLAQEGIDYTGFLYAGLMIDSGGKAHLLEFNCRLGDPEAQPILMRLKTDLIDIVRAVRDRELRSIEIEWTPKAALGVVAAANGYPGQYRSGETITGLDFDASEDVKVFHAGTKAMDDGSVAVSGGRILCVTALGDGIAQAQSNAYQAISQIAIDGMHYRTDIGAKAMGHLQSKQ